MRADGVLGYFGSMPILLMRAGCMYQCCACRRDDRLIREGEPFAWIQSRGSGYFVHLGDCLLALGCGVEPMPEISSEPGPDETDALEAAGG